MVEVKESEESVRRSTRWIVDFGVWKMRGRGGREKMEETLPMPFLPLPRLTHSPPLPDTEQVVLEGQKGIRD